MPKFNRLVSGGIITNYYCSSKCRHCVYASSPSWPKDYMTVAMADDIFHFLKESGCRVVHIGGGEPLLDPDSLFPVLKAAQDHSIDIEYIETNASWYRDADRTGDLLRKLQQHKVDTLLISIDPFHNEFISFDKVKALIEACRQLGTSVFPWLMEFWSDLEAMGDTQTHRLEEYESLFGPGYQLKLLRRYQLNLRGRALQTFKAYLKTYPVREILMNSSPCGELSGVHHFHIDLYGNFVPQTCAGLSIHYKDLKQEITPEKYPLFHALYTKGIKELYEMAVNRYGFTPKECYAGKCELCYDIRRYLVMDIRQDLPDLQPAGHYIYM
ncbi:MAG TPA: radical SAM protein [Candidatus Nitrosocosmicus sp.]|nr:radical SAM protein [Candidatus Nitrosocosmicus sp.]